MEKRTLESDSGSAKKKQKTDNPPGSSQPTAASSSKPPEAVTECSFTKSLATAKSLESKSFRDIAQQLKVLNVSGVPDLTWRKLEITLKRTKTLVDLDVLCTQINMEHFLDIVKVRPTLKSIAISFAFGHTREVIGQKVITKYQRAFEGFENVKFATAEDEAFRLSDVALKVLQKAKLNNLTFIIDCNYTFGFNKEVDEDMISLKQFQVYFLRGLAKSALDLAIFSVMDFNNYEIIILEASENMTEVRVYATSLLKNIICEKYSVDVEILSDSPPLSTTFKDKLKLLFRNYTDGMTVMFWDKKRTNFNKTFKSKLFQYLKEYLVFKINPSSLEQVPLEFEWYGIEQSTSDTNETNTEIDFGAAFKEKKEIRLNVSLDKSFYNYIVKPMSNNSDFIEKITHLSFTGESSYYDVSFFNKLFDHCNSLITLQVSNIKDPEGLKFLYKCESLNNFYAEHINIKYDLLFDYLRYCRSLENVILVDVNDDTVREMSLFFDACEDLYNFSIQIEEYDNKGIEGITKMCKTVKNIVGRKVLNIDIRGGYGYFYRTHSSVFNACQFRPIYSLDKLIREK